MEEEEIVSEIVNKIATKVIEGENIFLSKSLNNNIPQQYDNQKKSTISNDKKMPIVKRESDLVKRFIEKKERKSKVIINNNNVGLFLEQERNNNEEWDVYIKDLSIADNPRIEREKFGNNYKKAEKYYSELFFKYQFDEIKKKDNKIFKCQLDDIEKIDYKHHRKIIENDIKDCGTKKERRDTAIGGMIVGGVTYIFYGLGFAAVISLVSPPAAFAVSFLTPMVGSIMGGLWGYFGYK